MTFRRYAAERIGITLLVLLLAAVFTYVCFHVLANPPRALPASRPGYIARYHGFQRESLGDFLWNLVGHASLDRSLDTGEDLTVPVLHLAPRTFSLAGGAVVFGLLVGVPLGLAWTRRPRLVRPFGAPIVHLSLAVWSLALALWLSYLLGYKADLLPLGGYCDFFGTATAGQCAGPRQWASHLILPWICLGLVSIAVYTVVVRRLAAGVQRARREAAKDPGDAERVARRRAVVTFAKLVARNLFWFVGGAVFVESFFGLEGLDQAFVYTAGHNPPVAEAILILTTLLTIGGWLVVDLVGAALSTTWREL
jgi:ABC-type dipeptide/oligopeptide/nickel transport system permease component